MNSRSVLSTALHELSESPVQLIHRASEALPRRRVLRSPAFVGRAQPLNLSALLKPLMQNSSLTISEWVLGCAMELISRSSRPVPARWMQKLSSAFHSRRATIILPQKFTDSLPKAAWNEPALLGEVLCAARNLALAEKSSRAGRAGRVSTGCVYTPAVVARGIVAEVHVGARKVLDPACGAGVFLLEAFQRAYQRRLEGGAGALQAAKGALSHEVAGIDVDAEALAVTEFSLRLLALRCAGLDRDVPIDLRLADTLQPIPDLDGRCECIVGNPPFIEGRGLELDELAALRKRFHCAETGKINLFAVFVERSLSLLKDDGVMALVLPATFQRNARYRRLREVLLQHTLEAIKPLDTNCFDERIVETVVLRVRKKPPARNSRVQLAEGRTLQSRLPLGPVLRFCDHLPRALRRQIEVMERHGVPLSDLCEVRDGISTGFQPFPLRLIGTVSGKLFTAQNGTRVPFNPTIHKKVIDGGEFSSFTPVRWAGRFIEYDKRHEHHPPHPGRPFNCQLRDSHIYDRAEKIISRQTARGIIATVDREKFFVRNSVHVTHVKNTAPLPISIDALCACLNSKLYSDYLLAVTGESGDVFPQVHIADLKRLPILPGLLRPGAELARLGRELLDQHTHVPLLHDEIAVTRAAVETLLAQAFGFAD